MGKVSGLIQELGRLLSMLVPEGFACLPALGISICSAVSLPPLSQASCWVCEVPFGESVSVMSEPQTQGRCWKLESWLCTFGVIDFSLFSPRFVSP